MKKLLAAAATAAALALPVASADAHYVSGWKKVVDTKVNGLCGQGSPVCYVPTIKGRYLYDAAGHWRVYEVQWYNLRPWIGPWGTYRCQANKVWVMHNESIGSKTRPDFCWDK